MVFLTGLTSEFAQRIALLLIHPKISTLEEAVSVMIQEETRIRLQAGTGGLPVVKSALAVSSNTRSREETRQCYNCGAVGHLRHACTKPPKKGDSGGRGQFGGRGRGRRGRRGGRGAGNRANLMIAEEEEVEVVFTEKDRALLAILGRKQQVTGDEDLEVERGGIHFVFHQRQHCYLCSSDQRRRGQGGDLGLAHGVVDCGIWIVKGWIQHWCQS
ncbi:uncharacterized protein LOC109840740 [Asparagus officinalis]|uniref:uncharacterized protein LOC109840740 n=1 Tax=Asparagus officinalis TaxID=4686 RepID=UPI00098E5567|nr:uncharacterized protein LOC109840740 [Asparagus officinalis]